MTMTELRRDPVSGRWVIIAADRSRRPDDFRPSSRPLRAAGTGFCPFCAGSEAKTPPEIDASRPGGGPPDSPGWRVRVVPNKFPALIRSPGSAIRTNGFFQAMNGTGVHEVVIESPRHDHDLADLPVDHVAEILQVYRKRIRSIESEDPRLYVQIFKNRGAEAGASLSHPHTQIVATPIVPKRLREEIEAGARYARDPGGCLFCRQAADEETGPRLVRADTRFIAFAPFAARFPYETHIYPRRHSPFYSEITDEEIEDLALIFQGVLVRLRAVLADPPYNVVLHQAPALPASRGEWPGIEGFYHWHLEILPVSTRVAGFERGTGFYINPVAPETAAGFLRGEAGSS